MESTDAHFSVLFARARTRRRLIIKRGTAPFIYSFIYFLLLLSFSYFVDAVKRRITPLSLSLPIGFFLVYITRTRFMCRKRIEATTIYLFLFVRLKITNLRMYSIYIFMSFSGDSIV